MKKRGEGIEAYLSALTDIINDYEDKMYDAPKVIGCEMITYLMKSFLYAFVRREFHKR